MVSGRQRVTDRPPPDPRRPEEFYPALLRIEARSAPQAASAVPDRELEGPSLRPQEAEGPGFQAAALEAEGFREAPAEASVAGAEGVIVRQEKNLHGNRPPGPSILRETPISES